MPLKFFRSLWGLDSYSSAIVNSSRNAPQAIAIATTGPLAVSFSSSAHYNEIFNQLRQLGYHGIEASLADALAVSAASISSGDSVNNIVTKCKPFTDLLQAHGLEYICDVYTSWDDYKGPWQKNAVSEHIKQYRQQLEVARALGAVHVNSHSGSDDFTLDESKAFFLAAAEVERELEMSARVSHETHRGRILHSPWITTQLLPQCPDLYLTLDISHWFVVSERILAPANYSSLFQVILPRTRHVHARMGTPQHPQITLNTAQRLAAPDASPLPLDSFDIEVCHSVEAFDEIWRLWWRSFWPDDSPSPSSLLPVSILPNLYPLPATTPAHNTLNVHPTNTSTQMTSMHGGPKVPASIVAQIPTRVFQGDNLPPRGIVAASPLGEIMAQLAQGPPAQQWSDEVEPPTCIMCAKAFVEEEVLGKLGCGHEGHFNCIERYLTRISSLCPVCKYDTLSDQLPHHQLITVSKPLTQHHDDEEPTSTTSSVAGDFPGPMFTMTPEYGPPPYQILGSVSREKDVWDLWYMANWQMARLRALWEVERKKRRTI